MSRNPFLGQTSKQPKTTKKSKVPKGLGSMGPNPFAAFPQGAELPLPALEAMILGMESYYDIRNLCQSSKQLVELCRTSPEIQNHIMSKFYPKAFGGREPNFNYLEFNRRPGAMASDFLESIVGTVISGVLNEKEGKIAENYLRYMKRNFPYLWNRTIWELQNPDITGTLTPWGRPVKNFDQLIENIRSMDEMLIRYQSIFDRQREQGRFENKPKQLPEPNPNVPEWIDLSLDQNIGPKIEYMINLV